MSFDVPEILCDLSMPSRAADHLRKYFEPASPEAIPSFSGSRFETFPHAEASHVSPNEITAEDLLAVQCLGVEFTGDQALWILDVNRKRISDLLTQISTESHLWDDDQADIEKDTIEGSAPSVANELWGILRFPEHSDRESACGKGRASGVGPTKTSKLMARKRPDLFPIFDSRVRRMLGAVDSTKWYTRYRNLVSTDVAGKPLHEQLAALIKQLKEDDKPRVPQALTVLRACDVILWMEEPSTR